MTTDMQKHQGSIFFPLPDGTGLLYNLQGTAEPPKHTGAITQVHASLVVYGTLILCSMIQKLCKVSTHQTFYCVCKFIKKTIFLWLMTSFLIKIQEIPCKTAHTELLPVENWLRRPQRFRVVIDMIRPDKLDRSVSLHGLEYIDVPALGRRDYQLHFYSFKECSILAKVGTCTIQLSVYHMRLAFVNFSYMTHSDVLCLSVLYRRVCFFFFNLSPLLWADFISIISVHITVHFYFYLCCRWPSVMNRLGSISTTTSVSSPPLLASWGQWTSPRQWERGLLKSSLSPTPSPLLSPWLPAPIILISICLWLS